MRAPVVRITDGRVLLFLAFKTFFFLLNRLSFWNTCNKIGAIASCRRLFSSGSFVRNIFFKARAPAPEFEACSYRIDIESAVGKKSFQDGLWPAGPDYAPPPPFTAFWMQFGRRPLNYKRAGARVEGREQTSERGGYIITRGLCGDSDLTPNSVQFVLHGG